MKYVRVIYADIGSKKKERHSFLQFPFNEKKKKKENDRIKNRGSLLQSFFFFFYFLTERVYNQTCIFKLFLIYYYRLSCLSLPPLLPLPRFDSF